MREIVVFFCSSQKRPSLARYLSRALNLDAWHKHWLCVCWKHTLVFVVPKIGPLSDYPQFKNQLTNSRNIEAEQEYHSDGVVDACKKSTDNSLGHWVNQLNSKLEEYGTWNERVLVEYLSITKICAHKNDGNVDYKKFLRALARALRNHMPCLIVGILIPLLWLQANTNY